MNVTICKPSGLSPELIDRRHVKGLNLVTLPRRLLDIFHTWQQRCIDRKRLSGMSVHLLADMGIDYADARREAEKPFWRS